MEPMKPETVRGLLNRPQVAPTDIKEYQRLLSERFTVDPDVQTSPQHRAIVEARENRLRELHQKLFADS